MFACIDREPCVAIVDEFESLAGTRDDDRQLGGMPRVAAGLLLLLDGSRRDSILVAACNHRVMIDFASWRRFEGIIDMPVPDAVAREQILTRTSTRQYP